jgi:hypothetical protein
MKSLASSSAHWQQPSVRFSWGDTKCQLGHQDLAPGVLALERSVREQEVVLSDE